MMVKLTTFDQVFAHSQVLLHEKQLPKPAPPEQSKTFIVELFRATDNDLSEQLGYWASLCAYTEEQSGLIRAALILAKNKFEQEYAVRFLRIQGSSTEKKQKVLALKSVSHLKNEVAQYESDLAIMESLQSGYDRKYQAVSREITRREKEKARKYG